MKARVSAYVTLWCNRVLLAALIALLFAMPRLVCWYRDFRGLVPHSAEAILIAFYCCAPVVFYALWCFDRLTSNILKDAVFVESNVRLIRRIRWCCATVSLICLPASFFYLPLIFMVIILAFWL